MLSERKATEIGNVTLKMRLIVIETPHLVHKKPQRYWLWRAVDHQTGVPLAYCFGMREHRNLDELRTLLAPFRIKTVYADGNYAYTNRITESAVVTGKKNTQRIERKHLHT